MFFGFQFDYAPPGMQGDTNNPIERSYMADEGLRGLYWEENFQTINKCRVPDYHTTKFTNVADAFEAFSTLPHNKSAYWEFMISQMQNGWAKDATCYENERRKFHATLPCAYQYVVMENREDGTIHDFVCDRFPTKQFPMCEFRELYKEVVQDMTQLCQFWIDGHRDDIKRKLNEYRRKGKNNLSL